MESAMARMEVPERVIHTHYLYMLVLGFLAIKACQRL
jgi:hypothetical protein